MVNRKIYFDTMRVHAARHRSLGADVTALEIRESCPYGCMTGVGPGRSLQPDVGSLAGDSRRFPRCAGCRIRRRSCELPAVVLRSCFGSLNIDVLNRRGYVRIVEQRSPEAASKVIPIGSSGRRQAGSPHPEHVTVA